MPDRQQLDLRQLTSILPWMFILEMGADGAICYRLAGSALEEAVGRGMAGKAYSDIFADSDQAVMMEELYAIALVQSCGILRKGAFSLGVGHRSNLEVLVLPFSETRAMGGVVLVGIVQPFTYQNQGFNDRWGAFEHELSHVLVVPSPRVLSYKHLSQRLADGFHEKGIEIRALDVENTLEIDRLGTQGLHPEMPTVSLDMIDDLQDQALN